MKRGQVQITFNWIYVLIAGAVILLFFLGIVIRQKNVSEERLSIDVLDIIESIFTGAEVSEQTKNFVGTSSLAEVTLYFECNEGVTNFGIRDSSARIENSVTPIFSPHEIRSAQLILWSVPYKLPFKIMDFLFITSSNTKYYIVGDGNGFRDDFLTGVGSDVTDERLRLNVEAIERSEVNDLEAGNNFHVRIVDLDGDLIVNGNRVPQNLEFIDDEKLSAVSFTGNSVTFYEKFSDQWQITGAADIVSLGEERDAAKYAAIFAGDGNQYNCNMKKAFKRVSLLADVYEGKLTKLQQYYDNLDAEGFEVDECRGFVNSRGDGGNINNFVDTLSISYKLESSICADEGINCNKLPVTAQELRELNNGLTERCEVALY